MHLRRFILLAAFSMIAFLYSDGHAQGDWTAPFGADQVFIENLGQFDEVADAHGISADFVIDHGFAWKVIVNEQGASYLSRRMVHDPREEEALESEEKRGKEEATLVTMRWIGSNHDATLRGEDLSQGYYTYSYEKAGKWINVDHADGYKSLKTNNLYDGIDLTWSAPAAGGAKYALHLAPGADPARIRMEFSGAAVSLDARGNLNFPTVLGTLFDYAPKAWYVDDPRDSIPIRFDLNGHQVSFVLGTYDHARAIVIDPWSINPALPAPFNRAFEVDVDGSNNVYAWGGGMGYNLKKFNSAGVLQWTHVSPWDTSNSWFGELLTTTAGDCFISSGSVAKLRRLSTAGATAWTNNGPFFNNDEYWNMVLNCDRTKLICAGTRLVGLINPRAFFFNINMANGNQLAGSPIQIQVGCSAAFPGGCEVRELATGADGYMYAISNDTIWRVNNTFGVNNKIAHLKALPYNSPSYLAKNVQGINGIDIGDNFTFINWGNQIEKRNNATGTIVSTVAKAGAYTSGFFGNGPNCSGMVVDNCGNIYAGTPTTVVKFDANLASLGSAAVASAVYDIVIAPSGDLIVGGNGFVASISSLATCGPKVIVCPVLPADVTTVAATCAAGRAKIEWNTAHENNCDYFIIEKSVNEGAWQSVGKVQAKGSASTAAKYVYFDPALTIDPGSIHLYRLQAYDFDGRSEPSAMVTLEICPENAQAMQVYPAYTDNKVHLAFPYIAGKELEIVVMDQLGKKVLETSAVPSEGGKPYRAGARPFRRRRVSDQGQQSPGLDRYRQGGERIGWRRRMGFFDATHFEICATLPFLKS